MIGRSIFGASQRAQAMRLRLSSTGVKAGTPKRSWALRMPPAKAVSEMKSRYGKVRRSISAVNAC